jgi:hypothetical protein
MNVFDRFLLNHKNDPFAACPCPSCKRILDSRTYQLAAMTSLYISIKLNAERRQLDPTRNNNNTTATNFKRGVATTTFKLRSFAELSRGQFVPNDIIQMEKVMLATVVWKVHPPTPMLFCSYMLQTLMPVDISQQQSSSRLDLVLHVLRELARYLTELAVCLGRECSDKPASHVALAALKCAMDLLTVQALPSSKRQAFLRAAYNLLGIRDLQADVDLEYLQCILQKTLWPELLFDDSERHPISMARDFGLLDVDRLYKCCTPPPPQASSNVVGGGSSSSTPPVSPKRLDGNCSDDQTSPVSIAR